MKKQKSRKFNFKIEILNQLRTIFLFIFPQLLHRIALLPGSE